MIPHSPERYLFIGKPRDFRGILEKLTEIKDKYLERIVLLHLENSEVGVRDQETLKSNLETIRALTELYMNIRWLGKVLSNDISQIYIPIQVIRTQIKIPKPE